MGRDSDFFLRQERRSPILILSMDFLPSFFYFLFGVVIGSFLNVVIFRYNTGLSFGKRSFCSSCGKKLHFYELVPVLSFIFLRGRCYACKSLISPQYPIVEFMTGLVFFLLFKHDSNLAHFFYDALLWSTLIVIVVYDLRHKIIPDGPVYFFIALAIGRSFFFISPSLWGSVFVSLDFYAGVILALPFALIFLLSKGRLIGFGDAKLIFGLGSFLGLSLGASGVILAFWIGAAYSFTILFIRPIFRRLNSSFKNLTMKSEIPFAPFLIGGAFAVFITGIEFLSLASFLG